MTRTAFAVHAMSAVLICWISARESKAVDLFVTIDSSSIPDTTAGFLDFQFSAGLSTAQTAQVVVKNFDSNSLSLDGIAFTNSASGGPLPVDVTILNNPAVLSNRAKQSLTYVSGSSMSFILEFSGNALTTPGSSDSTFYFNLLNSSNQSILPGYNLPHLTITIPASGTGVPVISSIPIITAVVPEPGSVVLATIAAGTLICARRRRGSRRSAA